MKIIKAYANANIALVKYWGKSELKLNIPAVPSLSMTLDGLGTSVTLKRSLTKAHALQRENKPVCGPELERLSNFLENIRESLSYDGFMHISTSSNIPYGAGLASSAAFFAALAQALDTFHEFNLNTKDLSKLARIGSGSAARSILGGFVGLHGGLVSHDQAFAFALPIKPSFKPVMIIALVCSEKKAISSREAMIHTTKTSAYYSSWQQSAQTDFDHALKALEIGSLSDLGSVVEHSTLKMHASMWAAKPAINYLLPASISLMNLVFNLRNTHGPIAYFTMDAGPNVKILCEEQNINLIKNTLLESNLCENILVSYPGQGSQVIP